MDQDQGVGREVKRLREAKGWSQTRLAAKADMSVSGISMIENGHRNLSTTTLAKLAEALGVGVRDLFPKAQSQLPLDGQQRAAGIEVGEAFFVPLEEGEEEDTVTLQIHYVRMLEGGEPIIQAMRKASPEEVAAMRQEHLEPEYGGLLKEKGAPREQIAAWLAQDERDKEFISRELEKMSPKDLREQIIAISPSLRRYYRENPPRADAPVRSESA